MTQHFISIDEIVVPENRQRREFDPAELNELGDSIEKLGLLHPPVLRFDGQRYLLVAGERRLRAIKDLYDLGRSFTYSGKPVMAGTIPYNNLGELDTLAAMEAELEENIRRVDLSWQDRAAATARLASFRLMQSEAEDRPAPTVASIALEVRGSDEGINHEATRKELILAKHLDDPEVKAAKTANEAFKILKKKEETQKNAELAATIGKTFSATSHVCLQADSIAYLTENPGTGYDIILTDPPYGMGADEFGDSGTGGSAGAHFYKDDEKTLLKIVGDFPSLIYRIAKPEAHAYIFCDIDWFPTWKDAMADAGWRVFRTPLIWYKPTGFRAPWPEHGPQRKYEVILYAVKGNKKVQKLAPDVIQCAADTQLGHPAQKPVALYEDLLRRSARAGDKVIDPFCGSGPIFQAAQNLKLTATGIEMDPAAYAIAVKRLQKIQEEENRHPELPL